MFWRRSLQREGPELEAAPLWGAGSSCDSTRTFWTTVSCRTQRTPAESRGTSWVAPDQHVVEAVVVKPPVHVAVG